MKPLARLEDVPDPGVLLVEGADGRSIILTSVAGRVAAFANLCPHAGYPLPRADGGVLVQDGAYMVCGAHGASFRLDTGACAGGPCNGKGLASIKVAVRDGLVWTV